MTGNDSTQRVSVLHGLPLAVFALDGSLGGRGTGHQVGALVMALFFAWLLLGELVSARRSRAYSDSDPPSAASADNLAAASAGSAPAPTAIPSR
jgi:hypothetical protein